MARRLDRLALFRLALLVLLVVAGTIIVLVIGVPSAQTLRREFGHSGLVGMLGFAALYALLALTPVPASVLTIAAGIAFGVARGLIVVIVGATASAVAAFYLGRVLGRDGVTQLGGRRLAALDRTLRRRGLLSVLLVRLVPLFPYAAVNYLSGLTAVRLRDYVLAPRSARPGQRRLRRRRRLRGRTRLGAVPDLARCAARAHRRFAARRPPPLAQRESRARRSRLSARTASRAGPPSRSWRASSIAAFHGPSAQVG